MASGARHPRRLHRPRLRPGRRRLPRRARAPTRGAGVVKGRVERLTDLLAEEEIDVLLVTELVNVRYLAGYDGSNGIALIGPRTRSFATDFRYVEQAAEQVHPSFARARASLDLLESVSDLVPAGELRLGFDDVHMPVRQYERLLELLPARIE